MKRTVTSILSLIVVAGMATLFAARPPLKQPSGTGGAPTGLGFNMHVMGTDQDWDAIKAAGATFIRKDFAWSASERSKGEYDFTAFDRLLHSLDAKGIRAIFILDYRNPNYPSPETTEEGRVAYAKWAAGSVGHFKGRNVVWEIWNEPNVGFWKGSGKMNSVQYADDYVALVKKTVPAMRAADPDCYILGGSVSCLWRDSFRWMDEAFKQGLLQTGINALSVHPYGFPFPEMCLDPRPQDSPADKDSGYSSLRERLARYQAPQDLIVVNSEVGYPAKGKVTLEKQAMLTVRQYLVDQMCDIRGTTIYNWDERDAAAHRIRSKGPQPLPIYSALKNMTAELAGYHFVKRLQLGSDPDYAIVFENESKQGKIVAWTSAHPAKDEPDKPIVHDGHIPSGSRGGSVVVRDLYGKAVKAKVAAGTVTLSLTGSPQYIDLK